MTIWARLVEAIDNICEYTAAMDLVADTHSSRSAAITRYGQNRSQFSV